MIEYKNKKRTPTENVLVIRGPAMVSRQACGACDEYYLDIYIGVISLL